MKELTFSYNETYKISYQYREGKRYLLLIHGYLQSSLVWETFIDHLPPDIGIIAIDLPGHGGSSLWGDNFFKPLAHAISQLLEHHKIDMINAVGHSMGGYMALEFMRSFPHLVSTVTLLNSTPLPDSEKRAKSRARELQVINQGRLHLVLNNHFDRLFAQQNRNRLRDKAQLYNELAKKISPKSMHQSVTTMANRGSYTSDCERTKTPIILIYGEFDELLLIDRVMLCQSILPKINYVLMNNSGHTPFEEQPNETVSVILNTIDWQEIN